MKVRYLTTLAAMAVPAMPLHAVPIPCAPNAIARVVVAEDGLRVIEPKAPAVLEGDVLLQANGQSLATCAALEQALAEARESGLVLLLLVRRGDLRQAVFVERWEVAAAEDTPSPTATELEATPTAIPSATSGPPTSGVTTEPPLASPTTPRENGGSGAGTISPTEVRPPTPHEGSAAARESLAEALAFGRRLRDALPLSSSRGWASELERSLRAHERRRATDPAAAAVDSLYSQYAAALEIVAYKVEARREPGSMALRAATILEYSSDSPVPGWVRRFPFLQESVIEAPRKVQWITTAERPGRWQPDRAVELLVEHAIEEGARDDGRGAR